MNTATEDLLCRRSARACLCACACACTCVCVRACVRACYPLNPSDSYLQEAGESRFHRQRRVAGGVSQQREVDIAHELPGSIAADDADLIVWLQQLDDSTDATTRTAQDTAHRLPLRAPHILCLDHRPTLNR